MTEEPRSRRSNEKAFVRFINGTERDIDIIWINFVGEYIRYNVLSKGTYLDANTYKYHPWIAVDSETKDRLLIGNSFVYNPRTTREYLQERFPGRVIPENFETRVKVYITLPLYSLRQRCLLALRKQIDNIEKVDSLGLPNVLSADLKTMIDQKHVQITRFNFDV